MQNYSLTNAVFSLKNGSDTLYVDFLSPHIVRLCHDLSHVSEVVNNAYRAPFDWKIIKEDEDYLLVAPSFSLKVFGNLQVNLYSVSGTPLFEEVGYVPDPLKPEGNPLAAAEGHLHVGALPLAFIHSFLLHDDEGFYGLGDHVGPLDKRGYQFINYNTDYPQAHEEDVPSLYKSVNFFMVKRPVGVFGMYLDNSYASLYDFGKDQKQYFFGAKNGVDDCYLFVGASPKEILKEFTALLGRCPLPPRWSLGYQQCRWSYPSEAVVNEIVSSFQKADIPLEAIYLDIDYMQGYRIFTSDETKFPGFPNWVASLQKQGIKVVTIMDPGIKVDPAYEVYQQALAGGYVATYDGKPYVNQVWPGDSIYPAFNLPKTAAWWSSLCAKWMGNHVAGIWCDMNEPASFKGPLPPDVQFGERLHEEEHNLYGHEMAKATYEGILQATGKRPFVITRAAFAGTQRYSTIWTGDNQSIYSSLFWALPQQMSLGLSGFPFVGTDIGGFGGDCPSELMNRWIEVGTFSPLMRNHAACDTRSQEPYRYDDKTKANYRKWVYFRYRLVPYLYDLFREHQDDGLAPIRPLFLEYPDDERLNNLNDEFMWGSELLVAPVVIPGASSRAVYLPFGKWYPFEGGEPKMGGDYVMNCPLDECLLFAKEGSIIPLYPSGTKNLDAEPKELVVKVFPGEGMFLHYQDNGSDFAYQKGEYNLYEFTNHDGELSVKLLHQGYPVYEKIRVLAPHGETLLSLPK